MTIVKKITSHSAVDFAAEEFKKYFRMMNPEAGDVKISYDPHATEGFRFGLMQDFGLDISDAEDPELDDILYIDTDGAGGIIAGDNPRSVLLAVYEFFRQNGCRWLFPGVDGEYVPTKPLRGVRLRHKPSCRYRGHCIEGAVSQEILMDTVDFLPKVGMNLFMMQFFLPTPFYRRYYDHLYSTTRSPEPVSNQTVLAWKTALETEIAKRGLQLHDVGHGWTAAPFGIDTSAGWDALDDSAVPEETRQYLALFEGKRGLSRGSPLVTQFCMSNPEARRRVVNAIADYAERHANVDYIHVWLGDGVRNHCECEACAPKTVSDFYVILLNEIDAELTARGLATRIVFLMYTDTTWAPTEERIANEDRFTMMLAPIARDYTKTMTDEKPATLPFVRNKIRQPKDLDTFMAYYGEWRKVFGGAAFAYEYHFHGHLCLDPSGLALAKRVFEDITAYRERGVGGMIACATQRAYFPNGFALYVFARKQFDAALSYEELTEDYFSRAYGSDWQEVLDYLTDLEARFDHRYMEAKSPVDPKRATILRAVSETIERGRAWIAAHPTSEHRLCAVCASLLSHHAHYCEMLASFFAALAEEDAEGAEGALNLLREEMSRKEPLIERYYDHYLTITTLQEKLKKIKGE